MTLLENFALLTLLATVGFGRVRIYVMVKVTLLNNKN